jgi:hypothetical protein
MKIRNSKSEIRNLTAEGAEVRREECRSWLFSAFLCVLRGTDLFRISPGEGLNEPSVAQCC